MTTRRVLVERAIVLLGRGLRLLAALSAVALVICALLAFLLWDVDPWESRKRFEQWRSAWFGRVEAADSEGVRFISREVDGVSFSTGVKRAGAFEFRHCYARLDGNEHADRIVQVAQGGGVSGSPLVIWNEISDQQSSVFGLSPAALSAAAKQGCVFEGER